jgi:hypothetical protein
LSSRSQSDEKRVPYSVYLTPKAASILNGYAKGSGYVSVSRTVEEIILSFDSIYKSVQAIGELASLPPTQQNQEQQNRLLLALFTFLSSIQNATSRLAWAENQNRIGGETS